MINSNQKQKLIQGKSYWTYFMEITNKGNMLRNVTGVFEVIPVKFDSRIHKYEGKEYEMGNWEWKIIGGQYYKPDKCKSIHTYMNGYGSATCNFYETEEEAITSHDKEIINYTKYLDLDTRERDLMFKKLIRKILPPKPKIEIDSINWYKLLSKQEQKYVKWIKEYWEGIYNE